MTEAAATIHGAPQIEAVIRRAGALYSLPAVAVEVLRLTDHPKVDVRALKECIDKDPALTVKLLRVVNSSLFGLSREVGDLNQALALLGIKPLKLLVLGFSLPERLFAAAARDQLDWYWRTTLARAVAAREISARLCGQGGDDAFLAGLLADLGVLVLLSEIGRPYADLVDEALEAHVDLAQLERRALGFDHVELTAALLDQWNMPAPLVEAIRAPRVVRHWAKNRADHAPLVRALHLGDLFAQLVGQHRLNVFPDLLEAGDAYYGLDAAQLKALVADLDPKVQQLAHVLSLDVIHSGDYSQILQRAHDQLAAEAETVAAALSGPAPWSSISGSRKHAAQDGPEASLLAAAERLKASFDRFMDREAAACPPLPSTEAAGSRTSSATASSSASPQAPPAGASSRADGAQPAAPLTLQFSDPVRDDFAVRLTLAVGECRSRRSSLSVVMIGLRPLEPTDAAQVQSIERLLDSIDSDNEASHRAPHAPLRGRRVLLLAGVDRNAAVAAARRAVERLTELARLRHDAGELPPCTAAAGVATVTAPAKNFDGQNLVNAAQRCLLASQSVGGVKSLEVS